MDPNGLKLFANTDALEDLDEDEEVGGEAEQEEEDGEGEDLDESILVKYGEAIEAIENAAEALEACCEYISDDALSSDAELPDDEADMLATVASEDIPPTAIAMIDKHLAGITWKDALAIGEHLSVSEYVSDGEKVGALIYHLAHRLD